MHALTKLSDAVTPCTCGFLFGPIGSVLSVLRHSRPSWPPSAVVTNDACVVVADSVETAWAVRLQIQSYLSGVLLSLIFTSTLKDT